MHQGDPLDFQSLSSNEKVKAIIEAIKYALSNNEIDSFDIRKIFTNIPQYSPSFDIVSKLRINGQEITLRANFGNYENLKINEYANGLRFYYVEGVIDNVNVTGYWSTLKYRTFEPLSNNSAEAMFLAVKEASQGSTTQYNILSNYLNN